MTTENKAVFLDRDGVLIEDVHYLSDLNQVALFTDVPKALTTLKEKGFKLILVSNQSGVARGFFDEAFVTETHRYLNSLLLTQGVQLDAAYFCPHHLDGVAPYNIACHCRKPAPGMIEQAVSDHHIDLTSSFVIGDKLSDIELAINSGCSGILVTTGHGKSHAPKIQSKYPHIPIVNSFSEAVSHICEQTLNHTEKYSI